MENTIFDYFTAQAMAVFYNTILNSKNTEPYLGEELFPNRKQQGMELKYVKGSKGLPKVLALSAFDVKSIKRDRRGFEKVKTEMPFFKESMTVDETLRQDLLRVQNNENAVQELMRDIFNDQLTLLQGASVARERMRMQLLSTGTIVMGVNGQSYSYDYELDADQKYTASKLWSAADSDPIADIQAMQQVQVDKGKAKPTRAIVSQAVMTALMKNSSIREQLSAGMAVKLTLKESDVRTYILDVTGVTLAVYDKSYRDEEDVVQKYFPTDLFVLIPEGNLGETMFGTTPEEADLRGGVNAEVSIVDTGVAITVFNTVNPVSREMIVSQVVMPSFTASDEIVIGTVL